MSSAEEALELLTEAIKEAGYPGKIQIGMDVASSEFYKEGKYDLDFKVSSTSHNGVDGRIGAWLMIHRIQNRTPPNGSRALS